MQRVLVVDPDEGRRDRLLAAFKADGLGSASCDGGLAGCLERIGALQPCVVILHPAAIGGSPRALRAAVQAAHPAPVLVLIASGNPQCFVDAIAHGARGGILASRPGDAPRAVRLVLAGETVVPRSLVPALVAALRTEAQLREAPGPLGRLTARERDVLRMLGEGLTTSQIAHRLVVEPVTVRTHVAAIVHKLHVSTRQEAIDLVNAQPSNPVPLSDLNA